MHRTRLLFSILAVFYISSADAHEVQSLTYTALQQGAGIVISDDRDRTHADTPFAVASVGKTMTAVAILRQVERGAIKLNAGALTYLPGNLPVRSLMKEVTVRHLLTMTSGLPDYYTDEFIHLALEHPEDVRTASDALKLMQGELLFPPGTAFDYSNTNYVLLGLMLEHVTKKSYSRVMTSEIFRPAGMTNTFVFGSRPLPLNFAIGHEDGDHVRDYYKGQGFGDGGVISTASDLERFYRTLFEEGSLLGAAMMDDFLTDTTGEGYGMGIEIEGDVVGHSGSDLGVSSDVRMNLETGVVTIELASES